MDDDRCTLCNARMKREYSPNGISALVCPDPRCLIHDLDALDADRKRRRQPRPTGPDFDSSPFGVGKPGVGYDEVGGRGGRRILRPTFPAGESGFGKDQAFRSPRDHPGFDDLFTKDRRGPAPTAGGRRRSGIDDDFFKRPSPAGRRRSGGVDDFFTKEDINRPPRDRVRGRDRGRGNDPFKDMEDFMAREMADMEGMMGGLGGFGGLGGSFKGRSSSKNPFGGQSAPEGAGGYFPGARPAPRRRDPSPSAARGVPGGRPGGGGLFGNLPRQVRTPRGPAGVELEIEEHDGRSVRGEKPAPFVYVETEGPDGETLDRSARGRHNRAREPTNDPFARLRRDAGRSKWP